MATWRVLSTGLGRSFIAAPACGYLGRPAASRSQLAWHARWHGSLWRLCDDANVDALCAGAGERAGLCIGDRVLAVGGHPALALSREVDLTVYHTHLCINLWSQFV